MRRLAAALAVTGAGLLGLLLVSGAEASQERPVPVELTEPTWSGDAHRQGVTSVDVSSDGRHVLSGGLDGTVRLWDAETGGQLRVYRHHDDEVFDVALLDDGSRLVSVAFDRSARIVDVEGGALLSELTGFDRWPLSLAVSPTGDRIAVASTTGQVLVYDATDGELLATMQDGHGGLAVGWNPRSGDLASAWSAIHVWNPSDGTHRRQLGGHPEGTRSLDFSPSEDRLASAGTDKHVRIWDTATGELVREFAPGGLLIVAPPGSRMEGAFVVPVRLPVLAVRYSADGSLLLTGGSSRLLRAWDTSTGELAWQIAGHTASITDLALSPDGTWLVSAALDGTVRRWSVPRP